MDAESHVLVYKRKVADYCLVLLIFIVMFGFLQAYNVRKMFVIGFEPQTIMNNIV